MLLGCFCHAEIPHNTGSQSELLQGYGHCHFCLPPLGQEVQIGTCCLVMPARYVTATSQTPLTILIFISCVPLLFIGARVVQQKREAVSLARWLARQKQETASTKQLGPGANVQDSL